MSFRHQLKAESLRDEKISDYPIVGEGVALVADLSDRSVCRVAARKFARELVWRSLTTQPSRIPVKYSGYTPVKAPDLVTPG
jgi:hypothetical protein